MSECVLFVAADGSAGWSSGWSSGGSELGKVARVRQNIEGEGVNESVSFNCFMSGCSGGCFLC